MPNKVQFPDLQKFARAYQSELAKTNDPILAAEAVAKAIHVHYEQKLANKTAEAERYKTALDTLMDGIKAFPPLISKILRIIGIVRLSPKQTWSIRIARKPDLIFFMSHKDKEQAGLIVNGQCVNHQFQPYGFVGEYCVKEKCAICGEFQEI